ncbi:Fasciclin-like arabinogalactan protein 11 [Capsicum chinense]|nr:Fasciclin-like arabinogalactan protein 11 [Capsicum chinense]
MDKGSLFSPMSLGSFSTHLQLHFLKTISNPLRTQAGDASANDFPLNVTTSGNQVNVSTGVDDATVANTVYSDGQLAIY